MIITICSSANFYKHVVEIEAELEKLGHQVLIPHSARLMKQTGNFNTAHRTWLQNPKDYHKKTDLIRRHFTEIEKGDVILVVNDEKHGKPNYIGGNVLIEMAIAFYLGKKIYIYNDLPKDTPYDEEIIGMEPTVLKGNLTDLS
jgi:hypothetical protein